MMKVSGYLCEAELLDDGTLVMRGTNKAATVALLGAEYGMEGVTEAVVPRGEVAGVENVPPKAGGMVNGHLDVLTREGRSYRLHYRRKDRREFAALADALA